LHALAAQMRGEGSGWERAAGKGRHWDPSRAARHESFILSLTAKTEGISLHQGGKAQPAYDDCPVTLHCQIEFCLLHTIMLCRDLCNHSLCPYRKHRVVLERCG
jgi:hypothetical protein